MDYKSLYKDKNFGKTLYNEPLKNHTNFGIGGPADVFILPRNQKQLVELLRFNAENGIKSTVIGNGTNLLITDKGIRGCLICLADNYDEIKVVNNKITVTSGTSFSKVSKVSFENSLTGMEEISGIPGTIGGAVAMNAGAYGGEIKDVVESVTTIDKKGNIKVYSNNEMHFSYRHSRVFEEDLIVSSVLLNLKIANKDEIMAKYKDYTTRRRTKQPLDKKSAGSTFKRPQGSYASKLIDECGLRGFSIGDCQVSEKHCGFIINNGNATCEQMLSFIEKVASIVYEKTGFKLEREVKLIGEI
ncbi:MAG: UDP-N-acetylmuramate dehydrogenase [Peptoniphilaceae bacterium]|nr:UDP-N-acetylmuramate dehydrogenase [Peptoniphilaceae bacterium]